MYVLDNTYAFLLFIYIICLHFPSLFKHPMAFNTFLPVEGMWSLFCHIYSLLNRDKIG